MQTILVCAATNLELKPLQKQFKKIRHCRIVYFVYQVGIPLSLYYLNEYLHQHRIDMVISIGIAGSFQKSIPLNSVVIVERDCFGDMGAFANHGFKSLFEMGWIKPNQKPFQKEQLHNPFVKKFGATNFPLVKAITVQQMSSDKKKIQVLQTKYQADIESMEGACVHFVCLEKKIPFLQIRSISNFVGETNKQKWSIPLALENLALATEQILLQQF